MRIKTFPKLHFTTEIIKYGFKDSGYFRPDHIFSYQNFERAFQTCQSIFGFTSRHKNWKFGLVVKFSKTNQPAIRFNFTKKQCMPKFRPFYQHLNVFLPQKSSKCLFLVESRGYGKIRDPLKKVIQSNLYATDLIHFLAFVFIYFFYVSLWPFQ